MHAPSLYMAPNSSSSVSINWKMVCYSRFLFNNLESQSHVGTSLIRLDCWLTATEIWVADCAGCHSVKGKHQAHCHDYRFSPVAGVAEVTSRSCVTVLSLSRLLGMHSFLEQNTWISVELRRWIPDLMYLRCVTFVVMQADGDGFYEIKRPSTRLLTPPELNWIFWALMQHKCLQRDWSKYLRSTLKDIFSQSCVTWKHFSFL